MSKAIDNYLSDLGPLILEQAKEVAHSGGKNDPFARGQLTAYYSVLSLMKQQATAFGLNDEVIGLKNINIEKLMK